MLEWDTLKCVSTISAERARHFVPIACVAVPNVATTQPCCCVTSNTFSQVLPPLCSRAQASSPFQVSAVRDTHGGSLFSYPVADKKCETFALKADICLLTSLVINSTYSSVRRILARGESLKFGQEFELEFLWRSGELSAPNVLVTSKSWFNVQFVMGIVGGRLESYRSRK